LGYYTGITKARFWNAVHNAGHFINCVFIVLHNVPLVSVSAESFLVRTVGQWVHYLHRHQLTVVNILDVLLEDVVMFATLDDTVRRLARCIKLVKYCSGAYRTDLNI
jgi:hypothetical protein